jgi:hypothetical protein
MANSDFEFRGTLEVKDIRKGLREIQSDLNTLEKEGEKTFTNMGKKGRQEIRQLGFAMQRFGIQGVAAWGEIFAALGPVGIAIGALIVSVLTLTKVVKTLSTITINTLKKVTQAGVEVAKELDVASAQFRAVFQGNEKAAEATLNRILKLSREVGQNLVGVSRAFLPEVENLDQLEEILRIATALAQFQPEQGILGARIALQEFLSGETRSLRRRFEIPQADIDRIKEAFDTRGIGGAIDELNAFLDRTGRSLEDLSDTANVSFNRMREGFRQLSGDFGEPILEAAKEQVDSLNSTFDDLRPTLEAIAGAFGEVGGRLVEIVGSEVQAFIENIDFGNITDFSIALFNATESFGLMVEQLGAGEVAGAGFSGFIEGLTLLLFDVEAQFLKAAKAISESREELSAFADIAAKATGAGEDVADLLGDALGFVGASPLIRGMTKALEEALGVSNKIAESVSTTGKDIRDFEDALADSAQRRLEFVEAIRERLKEQDDTSGEGQADAILSEAQAYERLKEILGEISDVEAEIAEDREAFQEKATERAIAIETRYQRKLLDIRIKNARRYLEIEEKTLQKFEDLRIEYLGRFEKLELDQQRDLEDIARRRARKELDLEKDLNQDKIDAEKDYLRRLEEIRRRFDFDAQEAIRANDAIAFLRIQRRLAFELNEAKIQRDEDIEDAKESAERRRNELKDTYEQEIEDANIANSRKLEDLNTWLSEQTAAINLWNDREHERRAQRWEQERADASLARDQQLEDYNAWWVSNFNATEKGIADNLEQLREWLREVGNIIDQFPSLSGLVPSGVGVRTGGRGARGYQQGELEEKVGRNRVRREREQLSQLRTLAYNLGLQLGNTPTEVRAIIEPLSLSDLQQLVIQWQNKLKGKQFGGPVKSGQTVLVGEPLAGGKPNPEWFIPAQDGYIVPINQLAQETGRTSAEILRRVGNLLEGDFQSDPSEFLKKNFGVSGRQFGGPVRAGVPVLVGEPSPTGAANPEIYIPTEDDILNDILAAGGEAAVNQERLAALIDARQGVADAIQQVFSGVTDRGIFPLDPIISEIVNPEVLGGTLRAPRPSPQVFKPATDGYIIPITSLARISGKSADEVSSIVNSIVGADPASSPTDKTLAILQRLGIEGFITGGVVRAGKEVLVGEPIAGRANPEVYLPGVTNLGGNAIERPYSFPRAGRVRRRVLPEPDDFTPGRGPEPIPIPIRTPESTGFPVEDLALRQMFFSPPYISPGGGETTIDNSRTVEVVNPDVNLELSPVQKAQVKQLYSELRLEESLVS